MVKNYNKVWPDCFEMQLGDSDAEKTKDRYTTGDLWIIGKELSAETKMSKGRYDESAEQNRVGLNKGYANCYVAEQKENPHGEWNQIEIHVHGSEKATYYLNGTVVLEIYNLQLDTEAGATPLEQGRIGLQAEYAETFTSKNFPTQLKQRNKLALSASSLNLQKATKLS